jgi:peptidyl-prolyl cis-trans isomerase C
VNAVGYRDDSAEGFAYLLLQVALERYGRPPTALSAAEYVTAERQAARAAAIQRRLLARPEAAAVEVGAGALEAAYAAIAARYASHAAFAADLAGNGIDEAGLRSALGRELRVEAAIGRAAEALPPLSDTELEIFYWEHAERFRRPELRDARHLLVTVNDAFAENRRRVARARIGAIAADLTTDPAGVAAGFVAAARRHSECPTAVEGGVLGRLPRGRLFPTVDAALFSLRPGGVSGVVESPLGFHLVLCEAVHPPEMVPLAAVCGQLRERLEQRRRSAMVRDWLRPAGG